MADPILEQAKGRANPDQLNPKLAALSLARELMNGKNSTVAIVNDEFCLGRALMESIGGYFTVDDTDEPGFRGVNNVFNTFEEHSPSIGGTGRQQVVECVVNSSRPVYQGMNPLYEGDKPGAIARLVAMFKGGSSGGSQ
jgi:hypothetical protein